MHTSTPFLLSLRSLKEADTLHSVELKHKCTYQSPSSLFPNISITHVES